MIGLKEAPFCRTGDPIHRANQQGQLLIFGLGCLAGDTSPLSLDRLPEQRRIHTNEGAFEAGVEFEGCCYIGFCFDQGEVVLEFGDTFCQGIGFLRQGIPKAIRSLTF